MVRRLSAAKGRLLWRSDLVLIDGTRLPGIAIVSYANPFGSPEQDDVRANIHEAEADLCLALEMLRNQPLRVASVTNHASEPQVSMAAQKQTHWVASGEVHVYIDPREKATWSFFQRVFCLDADFVQEAGAQRSAQVMIVSLLSSLLGPGVDRVAADPFATGTTPSAPHSEFAIFAQPVADDGGTKAGTSSTPVRLVLGRRVTFSTRRAVATNAGRELSRSRSFSRQPSVASQTLHDVFSQAGLSIPTFGGMYTQIYNTAPRPDDPLPRNSISALLQARSKRKPVFTQRYRGASPVASSSLAPPATVGARTPGRRGEKRRESSDRKVAGSPGPAHGLDGIKSDSSHISPNRAIKHRADRILSDLPRLNLGKQPTRALISGSQERKQLLDVEHVKLESQSPTSEPFLTDYKDLEREPIEKINRNTIKKIVHTLLVREYGLAKSEPDYIASYNQTCSGTWCTFRNIATIKPLSKDAVEDVVRIHLSLYLYSSGEI
ncbi:uncharacterized protein MEPE_00983 [Melanopsichium pennsylvanicum]|uniref:Sld7 C-terminal domain-containing protein n=2 Tax=Melanopsichium pennsylvanicum TaxID=63383 RepID=A0AAJ5C370_9BASI|nr:hypothetical protein BN887_02180 [Melanopsichium pennsylvanicum 4]SNX82277.1 uncharacterized protein MEPE_00983 [Melanopsichium pennsylvanicum]